MIQTHLKCLPALFLLAFLAFLGAAMNGLNQEASSCWRSNPWCIWGHRDPGQGWTAGWCWRKSGSSAIKWGPHHKSSQCITMWSWTNLEPSWISDWGWLKYLKWWLGVTTSSAKMPHTEPYWNTVKPFWAAHWAAVASTSEGHDRSRRPMMARHWAAFNITSAIMPEPMCWWITFLNS